MIILQVPIIVYSKVINIIAVLSSGIAVKWRNIMLNAVLVCFALLGIVAYSNDGIKEALHYIDCVFAVSVILMLILLIASIDRKIDLREISTWRINAVFWAGWYICFLFMVVSSLRHEVRLAYYLWGILCLTVFPMLMIIWYVRGDLSRLCALAARSMVVTTYLFLLLNLIIVPFTTRGQFAGLESDYVGIAGHPNSNGLIVLPFFTAALYLLFIDKRRMPIYIFSLSFCAMIAVISGTRTSELAMILEVVVAICIYAHNKGKLAEMQSSGRLIKTIIVSLLIVIVLGRLLLFTDNIDLKVYAEGEIGEAYEEIASSDDLTKLDNLSSGRVVLWKAYLKKVEFVGHGTPTEELFEGRTDSLWAHNNAIDIWYASGFPAFAGYVMWLLAGCGFVLKSMFRRKGFRREYLLAALAFTGYFTEAMLEITIYPMYTGIAFLAYITLIPMAFKER